MNKQSNETPEGKLMVSLDFDSWGPYVDLAEHGETNMPLTTQGSRESDRGGWAGTSSFEEALELVINGWPDGEKKTRMLSRGLFAHVSHLIERQNVIYDVEGNGIDVAKYLNNEPECWQRFETELTDGPGHRLVRLMFNFSVSGGVSTNVIMARGAVIAALIELLEYAGHRVELTAIQSIQRGSNYGELRVRVKEFSQNLDMGRVVFALAHPSMLRRLAFSVWERSLNGMERSKLGIGTHYGFPCDSLGDRGDIYVGKALLGAVQWEDEKQAERWIMDELKKQGVTLSVAAA